MKWDRDLTGQRFWELTVLEATDERIGGGVVWLCRCSCGAICKVSRNNLVTGQTRSCGHAKRRDLTGQRFGRLVAVRPIRWRSKAQPCSVAWLCKCDCGSVAIAALGNLTKGLKSSCGCIPRRPGRGHAICPGCGETFAINTDGKPTPQFCPTCAPKYAGRNWKVCPICRTLFRLRKATRQSHAQGDVPLRGRALYMRACQIAGQTRPRPASGRRDRPPICSWGLRLQRRLQSPVGLRPTRKPRFGAWWIPAEMRSSSETCSYGPGKTRSGSASRRGTGPPYRSPADLRPLRQLCGGREKRPP